MIVFTESGILLLRNLYCFEEIRTLLVPPIERRRTARRHACQSVQRLRPGNAEHQVRQ
jgi:hypothetical protein